MKKHTDGPISGVVPAGPFRRPLALPRAGARRRIEVFSPKLGRRVSLGSYGAYRTWLVIEANPAIETFIERPAPVRERGGALLDFWVRLSESNEGEFWLIERDRSARTGAQQAGEGGEQDAPPSAAHGLPVRQVRQADLLAWAVPISNWARIVPDLVAHRRYRDALLEQKIVVYLGSERTLDEVLREFGDCDSTSTQAALFFLVAGGRVVSNDLAVAPLGGRTRFRRV